MKDRFVVFLFLLFCSPSLFASDLIEVLPLTNQILMLHFDDGYGVYHKRGQKRSDDRVVVDLLSLTEADKLINYTISSADDNNYAQAVNPTLVNRKTKGTEFTWICQNWVNNACSNTSPDHVKEHWVYLTMPKPMLPGKTYTLQTSLAKTNPRWVITFDEKQLRSEAVHVNMIGYTPSASQKFGYVYHWMGSGGALNLSAYSNNNFHLVDVNTNQIVFTGKLAFRRSKTSVETGQANDTPNGNFLGADVYDCDFSSFKTPGDYKLVVEGFGSSFPFRISENVYRDVFYTTIRGLYHNRSGIELKQPYTEFVRKAPHNPILTPGFAGKLKYTTSRFMDWVNTDNSPNDLAAIQAGIKGTLDKSWGWYQDAGDWDSYFSHLKIPTMLMLAWQITSENYADGELNIPEGKNGIPDILDEASWLPRCFYRIRHEIKEKGYGTGGIGTRICGDHFGADSPGDIGRGSWQDNDRTYIVSGEDPYSTYRYAGVAAQLAWCLKQLKVTDPEGVDWEKEAREAFDWAKANTRPGDETKKVDDSPISNFRGYAAACLYQLTGETKYHEQLKTDFGGISASSSVDDNSRYGVMIYAATTSYPVDDAIKLKFVSAIKNTANSTVSTSNGRACRWGGNWYFPMLVGQSSTPMIFELMMGWYLTKDSDPTLAKTYKTCAQTTADYFLGSNPLNTTWITGLGYRRPERVFHMDSWYSDNPEMVPGITPYGVYRVDPSATSQGPWDAVWPNKTIYPSNIGTWPGHERWFSNYTCPITAEFTVHQNTIFNAVVYGFLSGKSDGTFTANRRPEIKSATVKKYNAGMITDNLLIQTQVTDPDTDSRIYKVEFYDGWHKIGEDFEAPYELNWTCTGTYNFDITVKAYDELGATAKSASLKRANIITGSNTLIRKESSMAVFPNPAREQVRFQLDGIENKSVNLQIFNVGGELMADFVQAKSETNQQTFCWNPRQYNCSSGFYFYKLTVSSGNATEQNFGKIIYQNN